MSAVSEPLRRELKANYGASLRMSRAAPTRFSNEIQQHLYISSKLFSMGQFLHSDQSSQFLTTVAVLSCISVFAWTKKGSDGPKGFGAHVNIQAIRYGMRRRLRASKGHVLQELVDAMTNAFAGIEPRHVEVHLVGGHQYSDKDESLKMPGGKASMSWHVLDALRTAGFAKINQSMLNPFPGGPLGPSPLGEARLIQDNQRIAVAALHLETGYIVTHTDNESAKDEVSKEMREAINKMMVSIPSSGQPLRHVDDPVHAALPAYMLLIGGFLLWLVTDLYVSIAFVVLLFWKLQPSSLRNLSCLAGSSALLYRCGKYVIMIP